MTPLIVILAGGEGRRIGGRKPLRQIGGRSFIDRALAFARGLSPEVVVAVRGAGQLADIAVPRIHDDPTIEGPLGGIASALQHGRGLGADMVLTLPCDAPFLPGDLLARLGDAMAGVLAAVPVSGGRLHPSCALWRTDAIELLHDYVASGRSSLTGLARHVGHAEVEWPDAPIDPFFNINSEKDLAAAERLLAQQPSAP